MSDSQLISYIDKLIHCCLANKKDGLMHTVGSCPDRAKVRLKFKKDYEEERWIPLQDEEMRSQKINRERTDAFD